MASVFRVILRMSITASYVIAVVIILRMLMKSFSKKYSYCLWSAVLFRLCCPFSFSSVLSLFNFSLKKGKNVIIDLSAVPVSPNFDAGSIAGPVELGAPDVTRTVRETFSMPFAGPASQAPQALDHASDALKPDIMSVLAVVWAAGIAAAAVYALIRYLRLKKELRFSVSLRDNIRQADIRSPFVVGLFRPVIYVPFCGNEAALKVSIEHEKYHIQRKDHWVRALSFCLLCIHWFNPLCWIAYHLMICDMEMSCDEHVISGRADTKDAYVDALLSFATGKKSLVSGRLYFGGSKLKERIKNIMRLKHSGRAASVIAVLICVFTLAACSFNGIAVAAEGTEASIPDLPMIPVHSDDGEMQRDLAELYGNNNNKTLVVAEVRDMAEGWTLQGVRLEGYPFGGIKCRHINCSVMTYFNYARMRAAADDNNSRYTYFSIGDSAWYGGNEYVKYLKSLNIPSLFYGDITDEFTGSMNAIGKAITYDFLIDWEYKETLKAGDVILLVVDPLVDSASNDPEHPEDVLYRAVISPLTGDHPEPYVAKFIDGKLQLPADHQDAFALKRLYDDTDPELTGIKDGDSVETVVNFLKAVEQDMIRYEQELKQLPASTDVSSIR